MKSPCQGEVAIVIIAIVIVIVIAIVIINGQLELWRLKFLRSYSFQEGGEGGREAIMVCTHELSKMFFYDIYMGLRSQPLELFCGGMRKSGNPILTF